MSGTKELDIPENAGVYDLRFVPDSNNKAIASYGPIVYNLPDTYINIKLSEKNSNSVSYDYSIPADIFNDVLIDNNEKYMASEIKVCLSIIGSDVCLWSKNIENNSNKGNGNANLPDFPGIFILRIMKVFNTGGIPIIKYMAVSEMIKASDSNYEMKTNKNAVMSSTLFLKWQVTNSKTDAYDWIGIFKLEDLAAVLLNSKDPIDKTQVNKNSSGEFSAYLPPNSLAGPYIFIYFHKQRPTAISDIINLHQPYADCPASANNNKSKSSTMSNIKHLVIICTKKPLL